MGSQPTDAIYLSTPACQNHTIMPRAMPLTRKSCDSLEGNPANPEGCSPDENGFDAIRKLQQRQIELESRLNSLQQANAELEASARQSIELYESAPVADIILSGDGLIRCCNPSAACLLGLDRDCLIGSPLLQWVHRDDQSAFGDFLRNLVHSGRRHSCDLHMTNVDGDDLWMRMLAVPAGLQYPSHFRIALFENPANRPSCEQLRANQLINERIINSIPVRVFWKDLNLVYLGCNAAFARDAGFDEPSEIIGKQDHQLAWKDQAEIYCNIDRQVIESGTSILEFEEPQTSLGGKSITLLTSKIPLRDAEGKVTGVLGIYSDITARKQAEISHVRLATAVEQAKETIVITDENGIILYANPAFEKSTGYSCEEALGQNPRILNSGNHPGEFFESMWATLRRGEVWSGHMVNRRKDGTLFEEEATISPIRDESGRIINYVGVKRDVTLEVRLQDQIRQSQKMEAFGQLAGGVAHDFNNILGSMMLQAELTLLAPGLPEDVIGGIQQIRTDAVRAANLTRQLLLFSHRQVLQSRELDLNEIVANLAKMLQRIIGEDVKLQVELHPAPLVTHADAGMLDQLLMNLVINSRDAMPDGGCIRVQTCESDISAEQAALMTGINPGLHVTLTVTDDGSGIDPEILPRLRAKERAWALPLFSESSNNTREPRQSPAMWAKAPLSKSICRSLKPNALSKPLSRKNQILAETKPSCWSRTRLISGN
jgi:PAS domain S-box-containing protein